jgi:hypothetical protein
LFLICMRPKSEPSYYFFFSLQRCMLASYVPSLRFRRRIRCR